MKRKVVCLPGAMLPKDLDPDVEYFSIYSTVPDCPTVGYVAAGFLSEVRSAGICPDVNTWDFVSFSLAVSAADQALDRDLSEDGWTREIALTLAVHDVEVWTRLIPELEKMLKYLSGDYWTLEFLEDKTPIPCCKAKIDTGADCVTLLSGGMDSLVGAINLVADGRIPIFVSHTVRGNLSQQKYFVSTISQTSKHFCWNKAIHLPRESAGEESTRARSIVFFAFAALAACKLTKDEKGRRKIVVAENGFISLNVAINPSRVGSLSTKTTHPIYMGMLQVIWDKLGLNLDIEMPYRFKTKGEMLLECSNQSLLKQLVDNSTSCGRFGRYKMMHCGRCVPCMVRRAAYNTAHFKDGTEYYYTSLKNAGRGAHPNDIGAMAMRCVESHRQNFDAKILGGFTFASQQERPLYLGVYKRGLAEIEALLKSHLII